MSYNLKKYYLIKSGSFIEDKDIWHTRDDMNYAFKVYGDNNAIDNNNISIHPSVQKELNDNIFSNKIDQVFDRTKIVESSIGERVELDLEKRIVTFVVDQSGSMTWNDSNGVRYDIINSLIDKMSDSYGGDVVYNLVEYGGKKINIVLFGVFEESLERFDYRTISEIINANDDSYFSGIRVVRKKGGYASSYAGIDGDILKDGFFTGITDVNLEEGEEYFYTIYTYDKDQKRFSNGVKIKSSPMIRNIPRGISIFKTIEDTDEIGKGLPLIGRGVNRDENTIGIWHFDEGGGNLSFDFSNNKCNLIHSKDNPYWLNERFVPSGISGLLFDGEYDYLYFNDVDFKLHIPFDEEENRITISAWIFPYKIDGIQHILTRGDGEDINYSMFIDDDKLCINLNGEVLSSSHLSVELNKWQYVSVSYDGEEVLFKINDSSYIDSCLVSNCSSPSCFLEPKLFIGCDISNANLFQGRISEVSVHNINRSDSWIDSQINKVEDEFEGRKEDNGDRLVVLRYEVPSDFNFENGKVRIVKNIYHMPSWEEDGEIIYEENAFSGVYFVTDPDDFYMNKEYFYKIFSQNEEGNYCFSEDSYGVSVDIPTSLENKYFLNTYVDFSSDNPPDVRVIGGNRKNCFLWNFDSDAIKRIQIYYSLSNYPVSHDNSISGHLIFDGWVGDNFFIHKNLENNRDYFYTIAFLDRYERVFSFINRHSSPLLDSIEDEFPMEEVENASYEIIDENTIGLKWDTPDKDPEDINAYFDQTIVLFGAISDEYGEPISDESPLDFSITSTINREKDVEDVFDDKIIEFDDSETYMFDVSRSKNGIVKAVLRMTSNTDIISRIKDATFTIRIKSEIKRIGQDVSEFEGGNLSNPFRDYVRVLEDMSSSIEGEEKSRNGNNDIFSFFSKSINVTFRNPWDLEIINRDNKRVYETCYYKRLNKSIVPNRMELAQRDIYYNGIYMRASSPFVARVKVRYKGEPVDSGHVRLAVWDATMDGLCACAGEDSVDCKWEGENTKISDKVSLQNSVVEIQNGIEYNSDGVEKEISYVDVPIYSTDMPHAINLYAKSERAGYSSIDKIYILFQNILKIDLIAPSSITVGRKRSSEFSANCFIIHPDYPNINDELHRSKISIVKDGTVVQWSINVLEGDRERNIYSVDNVSLSDGVYSYVRNGISKNVFFESVEAGNKEIDETHVITANIAYEGLFSESKKQLFIKYSPTDLISYNPRFLMEIDSYPLSETWTKRYVDVKKNAIWADGKDYKKIKIHRNPNTDDSSIESFVSASHFRNCSNKNGVPIFELSYGQLVRLFSSEDVEIIYGDIEEDVEHETGDKYLKINQDGFVDKGNANIFLDQEDEITYFYLRINKFIGKNNKFPCDPPEENPYFCEEIINECMGIKRKEAPEWDPLISVRGEADIFVDKGPVTLKTVSSIESGWPPISILVLEPLSVETIDRVVKVPIIIDEEEKYISYKSYLDSFFVRDLEDNKNKNFVFYGSIIEAKIKISWKDKPVPENTPVYVRIGENNERKFFIAEQNIYYTETDLEGDYSFVKVIIKPRVSVSSASFESIYIYSVYDERGDIQRDQGVTYNLRLDPLEFGLDVIKPPPVPETDDIVSPIEPPSLYLKDVDRYDILENKWEKSSSMNESRGNAFCGVINNNIFVAGGINRENINISTTVENYDPHMDLWTYSDNSGFTPRFSGMSVSYNDKIFMIGGIEKGIRGDEFNLSNRTEVFSIDSSGEMWGELSSMPEEIAFGSSCIVTINGKKYIYIIGGVNDASISSNNQNINGYSSAIHRYDIEENNWESFYIASQSILLLYQRILPLSIFHNGKILVFNGAIEESNMFFYPSNNFSITLEEDMQDTSINLGDAYMTGFPVPKFQSSMSYYDNSYYIFGGGDTFSSSLDLVEKITISGSGIIYENSENENSSSLNKIPTSIHAPVSAYVDVICDSSLSLKPYIYVIGGYRSTFSKNNIDISIEV